MESPTNDSILPRQLKTPHAAAKAASVKVKSHPTFSTTVIEMFDTPLYINVVLFSYYESNLGQLKVVLLDIRHSYPIVIDLSVSRDPTIMYI